MEIIDVVKELRMRLPKFPDGRIDYSKSDSAAILTIFVRYGGELLLLKRSHKVWTYKGKWNTVAGYFDELCPARENVLEELREEIGLGEDSISSMHFGEVYAFYDVSYNVNWIVQPVMVDLKKKPDIKLDWEHTEYRWVKRGDLKKFDVVFNLEKSLENATK
ncbi:MAG: NUDIX domain-containing protein [Candidatus Altiarchaeota archaeon]